MSLSGTNNQKEELEKQMKALKVQQEVLTKEIIQIQQLENVFYNAYAEGHISASAYLRTSGKKTIAFFQFNQNSLAILKIEAEITKIKEDIKQDKIEQEFCTLDFGF